MTRFRRLVARQRWVAAWLVAAALAVRLIVPAGYMPAAPGSLTLTICSGHMTAATMAMPVPVGTDGTRHPQHHGGSDQPCPYAGLAMPLLAGADQPVIAPPRVAPFAGIDRLPDTQAPPQRAFLRPPLRGPPALG